MFGRSNKTTSEEAVARDDGSRDGAAPERVNEGPRQVDPQGPGLAASERDSDNVPGPDDRRKPQKPKDLHKGSWRYALRKTLHEFGEDQCTDLAAALTYYAVLSIFPAVLAIISILGVVGQKSLLDQVLKAVRPLIHSQKTYHTVQNTLQSLTDSGGAGLALIIGLLAALWSASGYVGAFGRALNRVYEVEEGRPIWKLRPIQLVITLITLILCTVGMVILVVSGPVAQSIGSVIGLGSTAVQVWNIAKWPVLGIIVVIIVALLYHSTPNVRQPKFRWISLGAFLAIIVWVLASIGFAFYVGNFSSYNKTYGSLAGVIVFLLWLWITNLALLFGAELDAELERSRQLQAGMPAEEAIQLPVRDNRGILKQEKKRDKDVDRGRRLRMASAGKGDPEDRPFGRKDKRRR